MKTETISIIGNGNVATHLKLAISGCGHEVATVNPRTLDNLDYNAGIIIIAVADKAIKEVAESLRQLLGNYEGIVVHCAGAVEMNILSGFKNYGVFYPLQTFSKEIAIKNYREIPIFIEGNTPAAETALKVFADKFFNSSYRYNSAQRKALHVAAVFVCNFVNALYGAGKEILEHENMLFELLHPLIKQTAYKALVRNPKDCQTGPAVRGDEATMKSHLELLRGNDDLGVIYNVMSDYIKKQSYE